MTILITSLYLYTKKILKGSFYFFSLYLMGALVFSFYDRSFNKQGDFSESLFRYLFLPFDQTIYSERFSYTNFRTLKVGINKNEVIKIIGKPLLKICFTNECRWYYTRLPEEIYGYYDAKYLDFENDQVIEIHDYYSGD